MSAPQNPFEPPAPGSGQRSYGYGPPPPAGWGPPPQPGQVPSGYGDPAGPPKTEVKAMIALGLAIAAYTPTIPFIGAIAALVLAHLARRDILASGGRLTGLSLCTWAIVLSWIHLVLVFLLFLFLLALFVLPFSLL